ncbi:MAG: hypothetical protein II735_03845 [Clostridia bacterium]|nr:hypothetical protein [Clostridia bacterium]HCA54203.1 hypothetical protein [Oscillospiraceae bacterium]
MATPKITFEAKIREQTVRMYADVPLKNAAGAIMNVLTQISQKVNLFNNKFVLCFGWSFYYLVERTDENGNKFWLIETDDYTTNPLKNRTDNATVSLITQNMQRECVQVAKVKPEGCTCKDTILVLKDAIEAEEVYMHRKSPAKDGDSGWYFGLLDDPKEEERPLSDFQTVPSWQLTRIRMGAVRVLQMPVGTVAVFKGNDMTALVDGEDRPLRFTTEEERKHLGEKQRAEFEAEVNKAREAAAQKAAADKEPIQLHEVLPQPQKDSDQ